LGLLRINPYIPLKDIRSFILFLKKQNNFCSHKNSPKWNPLLEFLLRFKDGSPSPDDEDNFSRHIYPHATLILGCAYKLCRDKDQAEDLVQETFYHALKNFHQLRDHTKCKYWLFSILRNLFLKTVEKRKNWIEIEFDSVCESLQDTNKMNPEHDFLQKELKNNIQCALDTLDERLKFPILLFYFEGRSYKEIAEILNIPMGTVMSRIARAKVYLKRELIKNKSILGQSG
jgi:RNA polymerase sigma-70 factor (ECF subfamily)